MAANGIFCHTHKSVPFSAIIREVSPAADGSKYRDPQLDLGTLRPKWDASITSLPSELREREGRENVRAKVDGGGQEMGIMSKHEQSSWTHRDDSSVHTACEGQCQILSAYTMAPVRIFTGALWEWTNGSLIPVPYLGLLSFRWFVPSNSDLLAFVLHYYILYCYILKKMSEWMNE